MNANERKLKKHKFFIQERVDCSFVGWARFFAHVLTDPSAWAKKRAHPTVTTKEVAFHLRSSVDKNVFLYAGVIGLFLPFTFKILNVNLQEEII